MSPAGGPAGEGATTARDDGARKASTWRERLAAPLREFGVSGGLVYLVDRALQRVSPGLRLFVYDLMVQPIVAGDLPGARLARNLEIRPIALDAPEIAAMPVRPDAMASRRAQACGCVGAFRRGAMIGYMWYARDAYAEDEVRCTYAVAPRGKAVFDFDFYLYPEHRGGVGFAGLWNGANRVLREQGMRYTYSRVTRSNVASRRAHAHLGARRIGVATFLTAGRWQAMVATVPPFVHVCGPRGTGPRLQLRAREASASR